jgi:hypothetical protein
MCEYAWVNEFYESPYECPPGEEMINFLKNALKGGPQTSNENRCTNRKMPENGTMEINGGLYNLRNWGHAGFMVSGEADFTEGDKVAIKVSIPLKDKVLEFAGSAILTRVDKFNREVAGLFTEINPEARIAMEQHLA